MAHICPPPHTHTLPTHTLPHTYFPHTHTHTHTMGLNIGRCINVFKRALTGPQKQPECTHLHVCLYLDNCRCHSNMPWASCNVEGIKCGLELLCVCDNGICVLDGLMVFIYEYMVIFQNVYNMTCFLLLLRC